MPLTSGTRLGPYEIESPLGAGGMGEVYRARDTRLERTVAIKVLPASLSSDPSLKQRLDREARAVSKLSHPYICMLHDIGHQAGVDYLVLEYLEGETLDRRLRAGPLPPEQTLRLGAQIADALAKAHKLGITHRDVKPANIMLTKSGVKLMDFGLAKQGLASFSDSMTEVTGGREKLTSAGMIIGTFQYMAPEQLEGKEADARTDIFALGAVLFEMATGQPAFNAKSRASLIASILTVEPPPISQLQPLSPPALERIVKKCLAKDPEDRWQSASDLAGELQWIAGGSQSAVAAGTPRAKSGRSSYLPWIVAGIAVLIAVAAAIRVFLRPASVSGPRTRFALEAPGKMSIRVAGQEGGSVAVSPDGQRVAFVATDEAGKQQIYIRALDQLAAVPVPGTAGGYFPFWSPDGASLGFFADRELKRVALESGRVTTLCEAHLGRGGSWNKEGFIVFAPDTIKPLSKIPVAGGTPVEVTKIDHTHHSTHRWPVFLPDGQHFLFVAGGHDDISHTHDGIYVGSLDGKPPKFVVKAHSNAAYADGRLLFISDSALMSQPFDLYRLELTGEPTVVQEGVEEDFGFWLGVFSVSQNGLLAYTPTSLNSQNRLIMFDHSGRQLRQIGEPGRYPSLSMSPDGHQAVVEHAQPRHELWIYDLERGTRSQFSSGETASATPIWSRDGKFIAYASDRNGHVDLYTKSVSGSEGEKLLVQSADAANYPTDWTADGKYLLYQHFGPSNDNALYAVATSGQEPPRLLIKTPLYTSDGSVSPDGRWVAYSSQEQGANKVFISPFSGSGQRVQLSFAGSTRDPRWRKDGKAVIYNTDDGNLTEVDVSARNGELSIGATRTLFHANPELVPEAGRTFDIAPDGSFIVDVRGQESNSQIVVMSNWNSGPKR